MEIDDHFVQVLFLFLNVVMIGIVNVNFDRFIGVKLQQVYHKLSYLSYNVLFQVSLVQYCYYLVYKHFSQPLVFLIALQFTKDFQQILLVFIEELENAKNILRVQRKRSFFL